VIEGTVSQAPSHQKSLRIRCPEERSLSSHRLTVYPPSPASHRSRDPHPGPVPRHCPGHWWTEGSQDHINNKPESMIIAFRHSPTLDFPCMMKRRQKVVGKSPRAASAIRSHGGESPSPVVYPRPETLRVWDPEGEKDTMTNRSVGKGRGGNPKV